MSASASNAVHALKNVLMVPSITMIRVICITRPNSRRSISDAQSLLATYKEKGRLSKPPFRLCLIHANLTQCFNHVVDGFTADFQTFGHAGMLFGKRVPRGGESFDTLDAETFKQGYKTHKIR